MCLHVMEGKYLLQSSFHFNKFKVHSKCRDYTWWYQLKQEDGNVGVRYKHPFAVSMYFAILVISQTGYGDIYATNKLEMYVMPVFFVTGVLIFTYLVADYSATLMLRDRAT